MLCGENARKGDSRQERVLVSDLGFINKFSEFCWSQCYVRLGVEIGKIEKYRFFEIDDILLLLIHFLSTKVFCLLNLLRVLEVLMNNSTFLQQNIGENLSNYVLVPKTCVNAFFCPPSPCNIINKSDINKHGADSVAVNFMISIWLSMVHICRSILLPRFTANAKYQFNNHGLSL